MGDILLDLEYKNIVGADKNQNVINAITFLSKFKKKGKKKYSFIKLNFEKEFIEGIYDVVILVNWIHTIDSEIIFDVVTDQTNPSIYLHRHSPQFLNKNIGSIIKSLGNFVISCKVSGQNREVFSLIKK